jgi:L-arabinose isomerase
LAKLPVARAVWKWRPDFKTACAARICAGGAHHTGYSYFVTAEHMEDFAEVAGVESVVIDANTQQLRGFSRNSVRTKSIITLLLALDSCDISRTWVKPAGLQVTKSSRDSKPVFKSLI